MVIFFLIIFRLNIFNLYHGIILRFHFYLVVQIAEMERTHPQLSFPGSEIKIHRVVVELEHLQISSKKVFFFKLTSILIRYTHQLQYPKQVFSGNFSELVFRSRDILFFHSFLKCLQKILNRFFFRKHIHTTAR